MQAPVRRYTPYLATPYLVAVAATLLCLAVTTPAKASLGAQQASIAADVTHFRAQLKATAATNYTVSELDGDGGMVTREFTNGSGTVFAVAWSGPVRPDLSQLFGTYFARFQADSHVRVRLRRPLRADDIDFVMRSGGHPGKVWGFAVLPAEVPQGFQMETLQ